jgi:WXXGXW repeat (2 copies)
MKAKLLSGALLAASTLLSACAGGAYVAAYGPPPPRFAVVGAAPGPGYMWTDGYWDLRGGNRWAWVEGRWMRPPRYGAVYVRPEWRRDGNHWRFHRGYWR